MNSTLKSRKVRRYNFPCKNSNPSSKRRQCRAITKNLGYTYQDNLTSKRTTLIVLYCKFVIIYNLYQVIMHFKGTSTQPKIEVIIVMSKALEWGKNVQTPLELWTGGQDTSLTFLLANLLPKLYTPTKSIL